MNQVSLKISKVYNTDTGFQDSSQTITKDIVAILVEKEQKYKPAANLSISDDSEHNTNKHVINSSIRTSFQENKLSRISKIQVWWLQNLERCDLILMLFTNS